MIELCFGSFNDCYVIMNTHFSLFSQILRDIIGFAGKQVLDFVLERCPEQIQKKVPIYVREKLWLNMKMGMKTTEFLMQELEAISK